MPPSPPPPSPLCDRRCWGAAIQIPCGSPTTDPTIKLTPHPKNIPNSGFVGGFGSIHTTLPSQQCGASEDARGWTAGDQKQTYRIGFGRWSNHPPYHTTIHPTQAQVNLSAETSSCGECANSFLALSNYTKSYVHNLPEFRNRKFRFRFFDKKP